MNVLGKQPMGADHHIDLARGETGDDGLLLFGREEAGEGLDIDRIALESLGEGLMMLLGEERGRSKHGDLLPRLDRLECGPDRDLGLAVADVAEYEPVHRLPGLHVPLDVDDGLHLVVRLLVRERSLHLPLPGGVGVIGVAGGGGPYAVQFDDLSGHRRHRLANLGLLIRPVLATHSGDAGNLAPRVPADGGELIDLARRGGPRRRRR